MSHLNDILALCCLAVIIAGNKNVHCLGIYSQSLNGNSWHVTNANGSIHADGTVPGSVYTDLMSAGILGDPYYRFNDLSYRWVAYDNWTYTRTFTIPKSVLKLSTVQLVADGIDTVSTVYINGQKVGMTDNMFRRYTFNIKSKLKAGENVVRLAFRSPVLYALERSQAYPYPVPPLCPPPAQHGECHFGFVRKEASSFSWDWGPAFPTVGVWKNISLEAFDDLRLEDVTVETQRLDGSNDWLLVTSAFFLLGQKVKDSVDLTLTLPELNVSRTEHLSLGKDGKGTVSLKIQKEAVELWWPNGLGSPQLYKLIVKFRSSSGSDYGERHIRIGFRTVELIQEPIANSTGLSFYFRVNGVAVFMKGSNWIPADAFSERVADGYVRRLLTDARDANINMLRVWGGGVYESEVFYSLTDELGILVWQDLMFACSMYPTDEGFLNTVRVEITHQVRRLKRHPSIAVWAGNNENEEFLADYKMNHSYPRYYSDYVTLYRDVISVVVATEDPGRVFLPSSPSDGTDTVRQGWVADNPQDNLYGDIHHYDYSSDSWDWRVFPVPRFASEYGLQSWCSLGNLESVSRPGDLSLGSRFTEYRQHHPQGHSQLLREVLMHFNFSEQGDPQKQFEEFAYLTQINQAVGIKTETEHYRRFQGRVVNGNGMTMGALFWQLNDIWQGPTWASIEYGGMWKLLHYYVKKFFAPQLISPFMDSDSVRVFYVRDNASVAADRQLTLYVRCFAWSSLQPLKVWKFPVKSSEAPSYQIFRKYQGRLLREAKCPSIHHCFLYFSLHSPGGGSGSPDQAVASNWLLFSYFNTAQGIKQAQLTASGFRQLTPTTVEFTLTTDNIAPFVWLEARGIKGHFLDNGFIMVDRQVTLTFMGSEQTIDTQDFEKTLTVRSLLTK